MRLDKYLKVSRLIKRRTIANEAVTARGKVNGRIARASYEVKVGDIIEIRFGQKIIKVEVVTVAEHAGKDEASAMYKELGDK
jgi:ribosomal 50S subunit-recycling heat shock protein